MQLTIRDFKETDREPLRKLYVNVRYESFEWLRKDNFIKDTFDADTEGEWILVAEAGQRVIGFISVWVHENFIHHLYIDSQFQRKGVGTSLLNAVKDKLTFPLQLKCLQNNQQAVSFYSRCGWKAKSEGISAEGFYTLFELHAEQEITRMEVRN